MKMVITEINGNTAIGLRDDGSFVRLSRCSYSVGQTVEIKRNVPIIRLAAACAAAFMLLSGAAVAAVRLPYSYVTLDINPSVKYTLNIFNRVLTVSAVNEDARAIVDAVEKDRAAYITLDDAIEMTIAQCETVGYLGQEEEDYVVMSVTSRSEGKTASLSEQLDGLEYGDGNISAKVVSTTIPRLREAERMGTTPGKLTIIGEMQQETGDTQTPDHWINVPVRDIIRATEHKNHEKGSTGDMVNPAEVEIEDSQAQRNENSPAGKSGRPDKSPKQDHQENGQSETVSGTSPDAKVPDPADNNSDVPAPSAGEGTPGQSSRGEADEDRGKRAGEALTDAPSTDAKQIKQFIAALDDADRELLSPYIEAYEAALAAEIAAAENALETEDLSSYRDAVSNALAALYEAAENNGIPLDTPAQNGNGRQIQGEEEQREQGKGESKHS